LNRACIGRRLHLHSQADEKTPITALGKWANGLHDSDCPGPCVNIACDSAKSCARPWCASYRGTRYAFTGSAAVARYRQQAVETCKPGSTQNSAQVAAIIFRRRRLTNGGGGGRHRTARSLASYINSGTKVCPPEAESGATSPITKKLVEAMTEK